MHTIGVLDSGIGGLTTCYYIFKQIPTVNICYYADNLNAPYGTKNEGEVYRAVRRGAERLLSRGAELIVLACNTATAVCIGKLRAEYAVPFIGIEPAVKPAKNATGKTLFLATPLTLKTKGNGEYFTADTSLLATVIEGLTTNEREMENLVERLRLSRYDNVILGCTHYSLLIPQIAKTHREISVFDGNLGVARQTARVLRADYSSRRGRLFLEFSGKKEFKKYLTVFHSL